MKKTNSLTNNSLEVPTISSLMAGFNGGNVQEQQQQPFGGVGGGGVHINLPFNFSFGSLNNNESNGASGSKRRRKAVKGGADVANVAGGSRGGVKVVKGGADVANGAGGSRGGVKVVKGADDVANKRQRRKIKNRESAARSRERKLAYSIQQQIEINELKVENESIKKAIKVLSTNLAMAPNKTGDGKTSLKRSFSGPL
ncbi:hypothetical protein V2J09_015179 [Rumex salicifolius]